MANPRPSGPEDPSRASDMGVSFDEPSLEIRLDPDDAATDERERTGQGFDAGPPVVLAPGVATGVARLLEMLSELPSTPGLIAEEAAYRASVIEDRLPAAHLRGRGTTAVEMQRLDAVAVAGLLDLLSEMPSTPPTVADDARTQAAALWRLLG